MPLFNKATPNQQQYLQPQQHQQRIGLEPRDIIKDVRIKNVEVEVIIERPDLSSLVEQQHNFAQGQPNFMQANQPMQRAYPTYQQPAQMNTLHRTTNTQNIRTTYPVQSLPQQVRRTEKQPEIYQQQEKKSEIEQERRWKPETEQERRQENKLIGQQERRVEVEQERRQEKKLSSGQQEFHQERQVGVEDKKLVNEQELRQERKLDVDKERRQERKIIGEQDLRQEKKLEVEQERRQAPIQERDFEKRIRQDQKPASATIGQGLQYQDQPNLKRRVDIERQPREEQLQQKRIEVQSYVQPPTYNYIHKREVYNPTFLPKREVQQQFSQGYVPKKDWLAFLPQRSLYSDQRNVLNTAQRDIPQRDIQFNQRTYQRQVVIKQEINPIQSQAPNVVLQEKQREEDLRRREDLRLTEMEKQRELQKARQDQQKNLSDEKKERDFQEMKRIDQDKQTQIEAQRLKETRARQEDLDKYMASQKRYQNEQKNKAEEKQRQDIELEREQNQKKLVDQQKIDDDRRRRDDMMRIEKHNVEQEKRRQDEQKRVEKYQFEEEKRKQDLRQREFLRKQQIDLNKKEDEKVRFNNLELQKQEIERMKQESLDNQRKFEARQYRDLDQRQDERKNLEKKNQETFEKYKEQQREQQDKEQQQRNKIGMQKVEKQNLDNQKQQQEIQKDKQQREEYQQRNIVPEIHPQQQSPVQEQHINEPQGHERHILNDPLYYQSGILPGSKHTVQEPKHQMYEDTSNYYAGQQQPLVYQHQHQYQYQHPQTLHSDKIIENQDQSHTGQQQSVYQPEERQSSNIAERVGGLNKPIMTGYSITSKQYQNDEKQHQAEQQEPVAGGHKVGIIEKTKIMIQGLTHTIASGLELKKAELQSTIESKKADYYERKELSAEEKAEQLKQQENESLEQAALYKSKAEESRHKQEELDNMIETKRVEQQLNKEQPLEDKFAMMSSKDDTSKIKDGDNMQTRKVEHKDNKDQVTEEVSGSKVEESRKKEKSNNQANMNVDPQQRSEQPYLDQHREE